MGSPSREIIFTAQNPQHMLPKNSKFPSTQILSCSTSKHIATSQHHLPARPPAAVCLNVSASNQPCTPSNSQTQIQEISRLESEQSSFPEISKYDTTSCNLVPHVPAADPNHCYNSQDNTETSAEPPAFRGDYTARGLSSLSISSSDDSIEEFLRLPEAQDDNIPIDPVILADLEGWEDLDLQPHVPQADSLITTKKACLYPDPPTILYSLINHSRDPKERVGGEDSDTQTSDCDHLPTNSHHQMHPCPHSTNPKVSLPKGVPGNNNAAKPGSRKRKIQQSNSQDPKQLRARSTLSLQEDSFTALQSPFMSLPLDDRLQFLSWLFRGALSCCMSDTSLPACEGREAGATCCSSPQHEMEQNPGVSGYGLDFGCRPCPQPGSK